jgi:hypothetical protein
MPSGGKKPWMNKGGPKPEVEPVTEEAVNKVLAEMEPDKMAVGPEEYDAVKQVALKGPFQMMGARNAVMTAGRVWASTYRDQILELIEPSDLLNWKNALMTGVKVRDRTCMNLFAETLKLIERERDMVLVFVKGLGYDRPDQLADIVDKLRNAETWDDDVLAAHSERSLREYYAKRGKRLLIVDEKEVVDVVQG